MSESTLSISYSDLQAEVGRFLGWNTTVGNWTSDNTADFTRILKAALRKVYYPGGHSWSFLCKYTTLAISSGDYDYDLPDDFSRIKDDGFTYAAGVDRLRIARTSEAELRSLKARVPLTEPPRYYAIRAKTHAPTTGHRWEVLFYPTPEASYTLSYAYMLIPEVMTSTNIYHYGGARYSDVILQAVLSEAERLLDDDPGGPHMKAFTELLAAAVAEDAKEQ